MEIIEDILSDSEIKDMPNDCLVAFCKILSPASKDVLVSYMNGEGGDPAVKEKLKETVGDYLLSSTFHLRVRERNITTLLRNYNLHTLPAQAYSGDTNINQCVKELQWLEDNERLITATVPARTKNDYDKAVRLMSAYQSDSSAVHEHNIPAILRVYKNLLFCPPREKDVPTGIGFLNSNKTSWKMQKRAAEYLKYCIDNGVFQANSREV